MWNVKRRQDILLRAQRYGKCSGEAEFHENGKAGAAQLQFLAFCCSINFVVIKKVSKKRRLIKAIHLHLPRSRFYEVS